ncbi:hypothetical protein HQ584_04905 [Patescibacteria group bacterium]|nr:hypothetical protein [Patescibacteria group bacterium]
MYKEDVMALREWLSGQLFWNHASIELIDFWLEHNKEGNVLRKLVSEIAQEAHTMGRIYSRTGERLNPAEEFERVELMVDKKWGNN